MSDRPRLIGVDWGTSNLRVLSIGDDGAVLDSRADPRGAGGLAKAAFPGVLADVAGDWLEAGLPVLVCGMGAGRGRWHETPYLPCPVALKALAGRLECETAGGPLFVPGACVLEDDHMMDVMRGEECQILGLFEAGQDGVVVAPGTHSKWATVADGHIAGFRTFMTGELFAAIRAGTMMGQGMGQPGTDEAAFRLGVERALSDPALTAALFSVRVETLADRLGPHNAADYLSGLLIGAEIAARRDDAAQTLLLVGATGLVARYRTALDIAGFTHVETADGVAATARGLWRIAEAAGL